MEVSANGFGEAGDVALLQVLFEERDEVGAKAAGGGGVVLFEEVGVAGEEGEGVVVGVFGEDGEEALEGLAHEGAAEFVDNGGTGPEGGEGEAAADGDVDDGQMRRGNPRSGKSRNTALWKRVDFHRGGGVGGAVSD